MAMLGNIPFVALDVTDSDSEIQVRNSLLTGRWSENLDDNLEEPLVVIRTNRKLWSYIAPLLPSFFQLPTLSLAINEDQTEYLNGLRGVASCLVFIHHFVLDWFPRLRIGYIVSDKDHFFLQLPIIRLLYSGRSMVAIFFIVSGYALSTKSLHLIQQKQESKLFGTLSSLAFRRGFRLYLPAIFSTFMSLMFCQLGWYIQDPSNYNILPKRQGSLWLQIKDWMSDMMSMLDPFQRIDTIFYIPRYDSHLWTLPIEYRGSLLVLVLLLALNQFHESVRLLIIAILALYMIWIGQTNFFLFVTGMLFAQLETIRSSSRSTTYQDRKTTGCTPTLLWGIRYLTITFILIISLCLLSFPDQGQNSATGYKTLASYTPGDDEISKIMHAQSFWVAIGAFLFFVTLTCSSTLQRPFTTSLALYLGRISYSLYLVHGPILYTLGMKFLVSKDDTKVNQSLHPQSFESMLNGTATNRIFWGDKAEAWTYGGWFCLAAVVNVGVCFYVADFFCRYVDEKSVGFARWFECRLKGRPI